MAAEAQAPSDFASGPRLVVVLVNQSASMTRTFDAYGISMAEGVADVLNLYLQKVMQKRDDDRKKGASDFDSSNFGILVIGYGADGPHADRIFQIDAKSTWANERMTRRQSATASSDDDLYTFSTWIEGFAGSPDAPLGLALQSAVDYIEAWAHEHSMAPPPYVVSITDGTFTGEDPMDASGRLDSISTLNGRAVLWTCQLTGDPGKRPILFPDGDALVPSGASRSLFQTTSELPKECIRNLMMEFPEISKIAGAKAAIFDADLRTLVRFLSFVTRVPLP